MMGWDTMQYEGLSMPVAKYTYTKLSKYHAGVHQGDSDCPLCYYQVMAKDIPEILVEEQWEQVVRWIQEESKVDVVKAGHKWLWIASSRTRGPYDHSPEQNRVYALLKNRAVAARWVRRN